MYYQCREKQVLAAEASRSHLSSDLSKLPAILRNRCRCLPPGFGNAKQLCAYAGLVPRVADSADRQSYGPLTKRGNTEVRWVVGQWALRLLASNPDVQASATRRTRRLPANTVRVALAREQVVANGENRVTDGEDDPFAASSGRNALGCLTAVCQAFSAHRPIPSLVP